MQEQEGQQDKVTATVAALRQHQQAQTVINDTAIDAHLARCREAAEEQLGPTIGMYWNLIDTLIRLHEGIASVVRRIEEGNDGIPVASDAAPRSDVLEREQRRREHLVRSLKAKLDYGATLLGKVDAASTTDVAPPPSGDDPVVERRQALVDETRRIDDSVLAPYLRLVVLPDTTTLWEHRQSLAAHLHDDESPDAQWWRNSRDAFWQWWRDALQQAGFSVIVPEMGTELDFSMHEIVNVTPAPWDQIEPYGWDGPIEQRIWSVTRPGLRRGADGQLVQAVGVEVAQPVYLQESESVPEDGEPGPDPDDPGQETGEAEAPVVGVNGEGAGEPAGGLDAAAPSEDAGDADVAAADSPGDAAWNRDEDVTPIGRNPVLDAAAGDDVPVDGDSAPAGLVAADAGDQDTAPFDVEPAAGDDDDTGLTEERT